MTVLAQCTWPEVGDCRAGPLVLPLGALEEHGSHLPLDTDTQIATALASELGRRRRDALIAPALPFGASGEHADFPGTLSLGQRALELTLVELVRGAPWCDAVLLVGWHGGDAVPVERAVEELLGDGRRVAAWMGRRACADAHAGRLETSLMLAIDPGAVRLDAAGRSVVGDPGGAYADEGRRLLQDLAAELAGFYDALAAPETG